jgi:hypothetical protein
VKEEKRYLMKIRARVFFLFWGGEGEGEGEGVVFFPFQRIINFGM